ncbi:MAG: Nif3-like dinuclear metal center hexameric protein [Bacteroidia bacterium]|nr:Nif3-like dinuclear metal center hexameric protein [Bacteroidia bacterium]MDW8133847.1 Nif3-like dinuclear metal center hexameric protein [Bacteroidia bacterium]
MTCIKEVVQVLETWAPPAWAESHDNVGLLWGDPDSRVEGVLTALEITPGVLEEAKELNANLIVVHHPLWYGHRTRLLWDVYADRLIYHLIQAGIAVYAIHTNADHAPNGVNYGLCEVLGLKPVGFLHATAPSHGIGYIGELETPIEIWDLFHLVRERVGVPVIRYAKGKDMLIRRVAVCGGAGSFLLPQALASGAQAFLTADIPYHRFFEAQERIWLADIGHYESEKTITTTLANLLRTYFPMLPIFVTHIRTSPISYWI